MMSGPHSCARHLARLSEPSRALAAFIAVSCVGPQSIQIATITKYKLVLIPSSNIHWLVKPVRPCYNYHRHEVLESTFGISQMFSHEVKWHFAYDWSPEQIHD
jgi:hypothetical protein